MAGTLYVPLSTDGESFSITSRLRLVSRPMEGYPTHRELVLQQAYQGSLGTEKWLDVPIVVE